MLEKLEWSGGGAFVVTLDMNSPFNVNFAIPAGYTLLMLAEKDRFEMDILARACCGIPPSVMARCVHIFLAEDPSYVLETLKAHWEDIRALAILGSRWEVN